MLACASLGNDASLAHALGEQRLTEHVVDLVRAGVIEILTLQVHRGPAALGAETASEGQRIRATGVVVLKAGELGTK